MSILGGGSGGPSVAQLCQELRTLRSGRYALTTGGGGGGLTGGSTAEKVRNLLKHSTTQRQVGQEAHGLHVEVQGDFVTCTQ